MASGLDSTAVFKKRALEAGLEQSVLNILSKGGVSTYGALAFITAYRPGQSDEQPFLQSFGTVIEQGSFESRTHFAQALVFRGMHIGSD